jgi:hypothetical protein
MSSDETLDQYQEIITQAGWNLETYKKNPVFQNAHQYGDVLFTLGKALVTEVRKAADKFFLFQRIQFAADVNPMARVAYGLYSGGFLKAVSAGFIPLRWETGDANASFRVKYLLPGSPDETSATRLPADLEQAAVEQVAFWFQSRDKLGLKTYWPKGISYQQFAVFDLLPSVASILKKYQRLTL